MAEAMRQSGDEQRYPKPELLSSDEETDAKIDPIDLYIDSQLESDKQNGLRYRTSYLNDLRDDMKEYRNLILDERKARSDELPPINVMNVVQQSIEWAKQLREGEEEHGIQEEK